MQLLLLQEPNTSEREGEGDLYVPSLLEYSKHQPVRQRFKATLSSSRSCGSSGSLEQDLQNEHTL